MKILATAKPNQKYRWHKNIDFVIQARINNKIRYYEVADGRENCISEELVKLLFPNGMIKDRPFLAKENPDFYVVLNRNKKRYKDNFNKLKGDNLPKFRRTKFNK